MGKAIGISIKASKGYGSISTSITIGQLQVLAIVTAPSTETTEAAAGACKGMLLIYMLLVDLD